METKSEIDSQYNDRRVTLSSSGQLCIEGIARRQFAEVAYLTARGARQLIEALEPIAAPRVEPASPLPVLVGTEWLTGADPAPAARWRLEYRPSTNKQWRPSKLHRIAGHTFASPDAAWEALRVGVGDGDATRRYYRVVPDA